MDSPGNGFSRRRTMHLHVFIVVSITVLIDSVKFKQKKKKHRKMPFSIFSVVFYLIVKKKKCT